MGVKSKFFKCERCGNTLRPRFVKNIEGRDTPIAIWECQTADCSMNDYFEITRYLSGQLVFTKSNTEKVRNALRER